MQRHRIQNHPSHRKDKKLDMLNLNQRLETYLGHVRHLEEENELLRREIQTLKGSSQGVQMGLDEKLRLARKEVHEAWREKDRVELELESLGEKLQTLGLQRQWVADAHGEVKKKLEESRKQIEEEKRAQVWLRGKVSQLEEQVQFQIQTHQEDVTHLKDTLIHVTPPPPTHTSTQLPNLQELGVEYSQMAVRACQEAAVLYQGQVDSLEKSLSQARNHLVQVGQEKTESLLQLQALEKELASVQERRHYLERSVSQRDDKQRQEIQNLQAHVEVLEMEKEVLGDQIDGLMIESRGILQLKMSLGMEVATYRALLDNENLMGNFSSTYHQRRISISDGVNSPRGVKQSFQTQIATGHIINSLSTIHGMSTQSKSTMHSSPIAPNCVNVNKTPERSEMSEEEPVNFNIDSKLQPCLATYPKVPQNGITVDYFRPQDVNEEVNYAEPLSPHTEEAGTDFVAMHGSFDIDNQSIWSREKEKEDQNIVRTWPAEEKRLTESTVFHQVESSFTVPSDGQKLCSPSVSIGNTQSTSSVTEARSEFLMNDENDGTFEMSNEKEEPLPDLPYSPMNELKEGHLQTTGEYEECVENEDLESKTFTSSQTSECGVGRSVYNDLKELKQEKDISYKSSQPSHYSEEEFHHVKRLEEDVLTKDYDEKDISNKYEILLEDDLQPHGYLKDEKLKTLEGFNEENMTEVVDEFNQLENISFQSAQTYSCLKEMFPQVECLEESDFNLCIGDEMTNQSKEPNELSPYGNVTVGWEEVGFFSEKNNMRERMDGHKEGNDLLKEKDILIHRESQPIITAQNTPAVGQKLNVAEEEHILSGGEKCSLSEQENVLSGGEKCNISEQEQIGENVYLSDNDKEHEDDTPSTSISGRAEQIGNSYAQENTLADTRPLIRYKSDETDANTQASYMGESEASDGEEDKEIGHTGLCTLAEGKSKRFDTMEDLFEESEGHTIDQEGKTGSTQTEDTDGSQAMVYGTFGNNDKHTVNSWNQKAEEEQFYEEHTTTGEYSNIYTDEDYNQEKIDRLVEQELENLSISSYSEHFIVPMSKSGSVFSLQAKDMSSEEVEQMHSENVNQPEQIPLREEKQNESQQDHIPSSRDELNLSESKEITSGRETLSQSEQEYNSSETMSSPHSRFLKTSENTSLSGNTVKMSEAEYLAQDVFSTGLGSDIEPEKENDQKLSVLNDVNKTKDHSNHSKVNSRPGVSTDMNKSDIEESNSSDDDSPNASQYLEPVTRANVTRDHENLLDVAISEERHSSMDCFSILQHSTGEVTNDETTHEDLKTEIGGVSESPTKHPESEAPLSGDKTDSGRSPKLNSQDQCLNKFFSSGVDNDFWGSSLETGDTYQPLKPDDHVTEQSNQNPALANNLVWGNLENPQMAHWNTYMEGDTTKVSSIEEDEKRRPQKVMQPLCSDMVEGVNVASEDEGDTWSLGDK